RIVVRAEVLVMGEVPRTIPHAHGNEERDSDEYLADEIVQPRPWHRRLVRGVVTEKCQRVLPRADHERGDREEIPAADTMGCVEREDDDGPSQERVGEPTPRANTGERAQLRGRRVTTILPGGRHTARHRYPALARKVPRPACALTPANDR